MSFAELSSRSRSFFPDNLESIVLLDSISSSLIFLTVSGASETLLIFWMREER